jgi:hypothetical protein
MLGLSVSAHDPVRTSDMQCNLVAGWRIAGYPRTADRSNVLQSNPSWREPNAIRSVGTPRIQKIPWLACYDYCTRVSGPRSNAGPGPSFPKTDPCSLNRRQNLSNALAASIAIQGACPKYLGVASRTRR